MRRDSGLPRGTWGESGKAPGRCGSQKRKKGPKALFSSTQAETWIMFGAGNESCTRALSLCFPINFSAVVSSEGLNSSLVFFPRQQSSSTNFHQRPRTAIPFSRHGRRTRRYQRPTTAAPLAQPGLLASEMATASRVETALGWMPCGPQLKVARGEGHAASEERWGRMFTSPGRLTTESERRTTASN